MNRHMALLTEGGLGSALASINMALLTEGGLGSALASINMALLTEGGALSPAECHMAL